ncbi:MAG: sulfur carrier protein ThiS [Candidatus Binataceae bacterium]
MSDANTTFTIELNGESHAIDGDARLAALLERLTLKRGRVAVEINRVIVPKAAWAEVMLQPGDTVEIVNFVGGG